MKKNYLDIIVKVFVFIATFVIAGFFQEIILHSDTYNVYLGLSIAVWGIMWFILYTSIMYTTSMALSIVESIFM